MSFPSDFFVHLKEHNYTLIKGGTDRKTFLEIWVVAVGNRVFARSWNKSEGSWFTAFQENGKGQLKYGKKILKVKGKKLAANSQVHELINNAYLERYQEPDNVYYAKGISKPEYNAYTMEFFYEDN